MPCWVGLGLGEIREHRDPLKGLLPISAGPPGPAGIVAESGLPGT